MCLTLLLVGTVPVYCRVVALVFLRGQRPVNRGIYSTTYEQGTCTEQRLHLSRLQYRDSYSALSLPRHRPVAQRPEPSAAAGRSKPSTERGRSHLDLT